MYLYVSWLAWLARKMQILNSACITQQLVAGTLSAEIRNKIHWRFKKLSSLFLFNQNMYSFLNPATRISCGHTMRRITRHAYILKKRRRRTQHRQHQAIKIWVAMMSTLLVCRLLSLEVDLHIGNEMHRDLEAALRMNFIRIDAVCNQLVGEVHRQRVLAGKDLELYVKYGQTRRFQIDIHTILTTPTWVYPSVIYMWITP